MIRYGGDEFLTVLPEINSKVDVVKQRIVETISQEKDLKELVDFPITLAIGSAYLAPDSEESLEHILAEADRKMYEDKRNLLADDKPR